MRKVAISLNIRVRGIEQESTEATAEETMPKRLSTELHDGTHLGLAPTPQMPGEQTSASSTLGSRPVHASMLSLPAQFSVRRFAHIYNRAPGGADKQPYQVQGRDGPE